MLHRLRKHRGGSRSDWRRSRCKLTWVNMAFQGPLFFPSVALESGLLFPSWIGPGRRSCRRVLHAGRAWFKRTNVVFRQRWYIGSIAAVMARRRSCRTLWIELRTPRSRRRWAPR